MSGQGSGKKLAEEVATGRGLSRLWARPYPYDRRTNTPPARRTAFSILSFLLSAFLFTEFLKQVFGFEAYVLVNDPLFCYASIVLSVFFLYLSMFTLLRFMIHINRLVDTSVVEGYMRDADNVQPRLLDPEKPKNWQVLRERIKEEVYHLKKIGPKQWTEFQILQIEQMLVDFLPVDDLKSRARSTLSLIKEYADDPKYPATQAIYDEWKCRIEAAFEKINNRSDGAQKDAEATALRAELKALLEKRADIDAYWAEGRVLQILFGLGFFPLVALVILGMIPVIHPLGDRVLGPFNWGFLSSAGAMFSTLHSAYRSDLFEIGYTEASGEVVRTSVGLGLGFLTGFLLYAAFASGLLGEASQQMLGETGWTAWGKAVLSAISAGFFGEKVIYILVRATP